MWCIQMHSIQWDHLHVGCWRHVGEAQSWCSWCTGGRVWVRLLPGGLLLAFSRFCSNGHPVLLWLICRIGSIGSICIFFQKRRSQVSSAGDLHARLCQKILSGQRKRREPFSFLERHSLSLGQWGPADLLCFCVSDSMKSSRSVFLAAGPRCFIMSFVTPSGPGAFLHFNCSIAASVSFMVMGWLVQLSDVGCFCSCV